MKSTLFAVLVALGSLLISCKNSEKEQSTVDQPSSGQADSLMADVMDGHDVGMARMGKIRGMRAEMNRLLDSISKLPAKTREATAPLRSRLDSVISDLNYAEAEMDKWMKEFDMDSAKNDISKRIDYLLNEKIKVGKVKEAILNSLQRADSTIKSKF